MAGQKLIGVAQNSPCSECFQTLAEKVESASEGLVSNSILACMDKVVLSR